MSKVAFFVHPFVLQQILSVFEGLESPRTLKTFLREADLVLETVTGAALGTFQNIPMHLNIFETGKYLGYIGSLCAGLFGWFWRN